MDTRLPSLAELQNPVTDPLEDIKAKIVAEVRSTWQTTKRIKVTIARVLTLKELSNLSYWAMRSDWSLEGKPGIDSTAIIMRGFISIMAD